MTVIRLITALTLWFAFAGNADAQPRLRVDLSRTQAPIHTGALKGRLLDMWSLKGDGFPNPLNGYMEGVYGPGAKNLRKAAEENLNAIAESLSQLRVKDVNALTPKVEKYFRGKVMQVTDQGFVLALGTRTTPTYVKVKGAPGSESGVQGSLDPRVTNVALGSVQKGDEVLVEGILSENLTQIRPSYQYPALILNAGSERLRTQYVEWGILNRNELLTKLRRAFRSPSQAQVFRELFAKAAQENYDVASWHQVIGLYNALPDADKSFLNFNPRLDEQLVQLGFKPVSFYNAAGLRDLYAQLANHVSLRASFERSVLPLFDPQYYQKADSAREVILCENILTH